MVYVKSNSFIVLKFILCWFITLGKVVNVETLDFAKLLWYDQTISVVNIDVALLVKNDLMVLFDIESFRFTVCLHIPAKDRAICDILHFNHDFLSIISRVQLFDKTVFLLMGNLKVHNFSILWRHIKVQIVIFYVFVVPNKKVFIIHLKPNFRI